MVVEREPGYVPPGWPEAVAPPDSQDWEETAAAWLLDLLPEYRRHKIVPHYPLVLAFIARHVFTGTLEGARHGYRTTRSELGELVSPPVIDATLNATRAEGRRLAEIARAVDLVERALRGEVFRPRL